MICPYCYNENKADARACDFCMREFPMTKERTQEILKLRKIEKKNKWQKTLTKLLGLLIGISVIVSIVVIAWLNTRG